MLVFHHHLLVYPYICPMKFRLIPLLDVLTVVGSCLYHAHSLLSRPQVSAPFSLLSILL